MCLFIDVGIFFFTITYYIIIIIIIIFIPHNSRKTVKK